MCGVVGIMGAPEAAREAFLALTTLQHRGQDAAGILTVDDDGFHRVKNLGLVDSVFNRENMATLTGAAALGHTRYSTAGRGSIAEAQPLVINYPYGIGLVHNGNVLNAHSLAQELKTQSRRQMFTQSDSEVVLNLLADGLTHLPAEGQLTLQQLLPALDAASSRLVGSYSLVALIAGQGLLAMRDPHGIRPLVWGQRDQAHMVASESVALEFNGYTVQRSLHPGEVVWIRNDGKVELARLGAQALRPKPFRPCMFEWVYFASPESVVDGAPVYGARIELGRQLAQALKPIMDRRQIRPDVIVPVPETARIAAIAMAESLGIPYRETLIKNRYIKRTFILDSQDKRKAAVSLKLSPVKSELAGKRVMLVDDSIVRGTTSKKIIEWVRQSGAKEVYFVSTCPPIRYPCYYGIDFPSQKELVAAGRTYAEIEAELGADAVLFQEQEGLKRAIQCSGGSASAELNPCTACLDSAYPTDVSEGIEFGRRRNVIKEGRSG